MVGTLKHVAYMDVSKNSIEMVDEQISGCENLQDLLLSNNALTQLPGNIGNNTHTQTHTDTNVCRTHTHKYTYTYTHTHTHTHTHAQTHTQTHAQMHHL